MLRELATAAAEQGDRVELREGYRDGVPLIVLYGVGAPAQAPVRRQHVGSGGRAILWDAGYFHRAGPDGYLRLSIDADHPQALLDRTTDDPARWHRLGIGLREDFDPAGPIVLAGLGKKSRSYLNAWDWEARKLAELRQRFPGRRVIYRPKPKHPSPGLNTETDATTPIAKLLRGASLVVCRHSNVAIDAALAGVPFEAEDGAATWLQGKPYTRENRLSLLHRLAWWQWRPSEARQAWSFIRSMVA